MLEKYAQIVVKRRYVLFHSDFYVKYNKSNIFKFVSCGREMYNGGTFVKFYVTLNHSSPIQVNYDE